VNAVNGDVEDRKSGQPVRILSEVKLEVTQNLWRNPAGARFKTRKFCLVEDDAINIVLPEFPGTGRPTWSTSHNQHLRLPNHGCLTEAAVWLWSADTGKDNLPELLVARSKCACAAQKVVAPHPEEAIPILRFQARPGFREVCVPGH
jgi:hypothetical protein